MARAKPVPILDLADACPLEGPCRDRNTGFTIIAGNPVCAHCRRPRSTYLKGMSDMKDGPTKRRSCGFCATGQHHNCSFAVANGDGSPAFCGCEAQPEKAGQNWHIPRCIQCGRRQISVKTTTGVDLPRADIDLQAAQCADRDDCASYRNMLKERAAATYSPYRKNLEEGYGQRRQTSARSQVTTTSRATTPDQTKEKTMSDNTFRVKAGGGKGSAVLEAVRDTKNHGLSRAELAERVGCTTGRVGEVLRYTLAEGDPADRAAVQAFIDAQPRTRGGATKKTVEKQQASKPAKKTTKAVATKKAAAADKPKAKGKAKSKK